MMYSFLQISCTYSFKPHVQFAHGFGPVISCFVVFWNNEVFASLYFISCSSLTAVEVGYYAFELPRLAHGFDAGAF